MDEKKARNDRNKKAAAAAGILILTAYCILAGGLFQSRPPVMALDVLGGLSVCGIAIILFPRFRPHAAGVSWAYLSLKMAEGLLMAAAGILLVTLADRGPAMRDRVYGIHTYIFILGAALFYFLLYRSILVPRFISVWGLAAVVLLLTANGIRITGHPHPALSALYLPIVTNEVFLAIWLIARGFDDRGRSVTEPLRKRPRGRT